MIGKRYDIKNRFSQISRLMKNTVNLDFYIYDMLIVLGLLYAVGYQKIGTINYATIAVFDTGTMKEITRVQYENSTGENAFYCIKSDGDYIYVGGVTNRTATNPEGTVKKLNLDLSEVWSKYLDNPTSLVLGIWVLGIDVTDIIGDSIYAVGTYTVGTSGAAGFAWAIDKTTAGQKWLKTGFSSMMRDCLYTDNVYVCGSAGGTPKIWELSSVDGSTVKMQTYTGYGLEAMLLIGNFFVSIYQSGSASDTTSIIDIDSNTLAKIAQYNRNWSTTLMEESVKPVSNGGNLILFNGFYLEKASPQIRHVTLEAMSTNFNSFWAKDLGKNKKCSRGLACDTSYAYLAYWENVTNPTFFTLEKRNLGTGELA